MLLSFIKHHCFVYKLTKGSQREGTILSRAPATSGTERERDFVGIEEFLREPFANFFPYQQIFESSKNVFYGKFM